jgi:hypothetical protein
MKYVFALMAVCFALSLSACTKKEETPPAPTSGQEQVEGTTTAPAEGTAPSDEMQEKKDEAPATNTQE